MYKHYRLSFAIFLSVLCSLGFSEQVPKSDVFVRSTTATVSAKNLEYFPEQLYCPIQESIAVGPSWEGITIGKSSLDDLKAKLSQLELEYVNAEYKNDDSFRLFIENDPRPDFPATIRGCLQRDVISALELSDFVGEKIFLANFMALYGRPDVVTWTTDPTSRVVFWFRDGIAITVYTGSDGGNFTRVGEIIYFPYLNNTNYQTIWPYKQTRPEGYENADYPVDPVEQNPFDFETIEITLTAQPSLIPRATPIATSVK